MRCQQDQCPLPPLQDEKDWQLLRAELLDSTQPRAGCSAQPGARWGGKEDAAMEPREAQSREGRAMASGATGVGHPGLVPRDHLLEPGGRGEGRWSQGEVSRLPLQFFFLISQCFLNQRVVGTREHTVDDSVCTDGDGAKIRG